MKKIIILALMQLLFTSCLFDYIYEEPDYGYSKNQNYNDNQTTNNDQNSGSVYESSEDETQSGFTPKSKYECVSKSPLEFNVYLGWDFNSKEDTINLTCSAKGGSVIFNIYTNNLSMSMYEFQKYYSDVYTFSSESPYCGFSNYSLNTQYICKYKLIIKENNETYIRSFSGYWASNGGYNFYSAFHVNVTQKMYE